MVLALWFAVLGVLFVAAVVPVVHRVLVGVPNFVDIAPLALPIAIYLVQPPFAAALRGMQQARLLFAQYVVFTTTSLSGLVVGARSRGLPAAAWGLTTGSAVGLVAMVWPYRYASTGRGLRDRGTAPAEDRVADSAAQAGG